MTNNDRRRDQLITEITEEKTNSPDEKYAVIRQILNGSGFPAKIIEFMISQIKFDSGEIMATPKAECILKASGENPTFYLWRHLCGDWGILAPPQCKRNEIALEQGGTIASCHRLRAGALIFCATDAARTHTGFFAEQEVISDNEASEGAISVVGRCDRGLEWQLG